MIRTETRLSAAQSAQNALYILSRPIWAGYEVAQGVVQMERFKAAFLQGKGEAPYTTADAAYFLRGILEQVNSYHERDVGLQQISLELWLPRQGVLEQGLQTVATETYFGINSSSMGADFNFSLYRGEVKGNRTRVEKKFHQWQKRVVQELQRMPYFPK